MSVPGTQAASDSVVTDGGGPFDACAVLAGGDVACWDLPEATPVRIPSLAGSTALLLGEGLLCGVAGGAAASRARCLEPAGQAWLNKNLPRRAARLASRSASPTWSRSPSRATSCAGERRAVACRVSSATAETSSASTRRKTRRGSSSPERGSASSTATGPPASIMEPARRPAQSWARRLRARSRATATSAAR